MSLFNRSNSSYTNLDIEAATVDFLTGTGADKQVSIDASGQLGIGTNAPASRIDVRDASHRGLRFISKTTTSVSGGAAATTIGNVSFAHETNGDGAGVLIDAIVTVRSSQSANHTSVRSLPFRCVMVRPGANSGGDSTRIKATTVSTNDGTTGTAFAELGSASTISSVSMSFLTSNASTGEGTCQIRATTVIDSGTANSIDFVGTMVGKADVTFS